MCTGNVRTLEDTQPGFFARLLAPFAGHNSTGIGMHQPYKMQLVIEICGLPRVLLAAAVSAVTRPFGIRGLFYKICGQDVYKRQDHGMVRIFSPLWGKKSILLTA